MTSKNADWAPLLIVGTIILMAALAIGSTSTWITLTVAGLAMGLIIFLTASGLTLIFGLMDVLHFGHGLFIAIGAYVAAAAFRTYGDLGTSLLSSAALIVCVLGVAIIVTALVGVIFERLFVRPVYGNHLKQILITMGAMVIGEELIKVIWGPDEIGIRLPAVFQGSIALGDAMLEKYRLAACVVGLVAYSAIWLTLTRTKIGLLIRAGVQDREMVESLGYPIQRIFVGVFVAGSALAGVGGVMWGLYQQSVVPTVGAQLNVLIFIVIIIGGLGSTTGALVGAVLVGLVANYTGFLAPKLALFSNIALLVAILMWRPQGLLSLQKQ